VILLPGAVRVYFATAPMNLRRSFDGLSNEVRAVLGRDPLNGHVFVFLNRRKTQVKLLLWTRGGFTIVHKRLEQGQFAFSATSDQPGGVRGARCTRAGHAAGGDRHEPGADLAALGASHALDCGVNGRRAE